MDNPGTLFLKKNKSLPMVTIMMTHLCLMPLLSHPPPDDPILTLALCTPYIRSVQSIMGIIQNITPGADMPALLNPIAADCQWGDDHSFVSMSQQNMSGEEDEIGDGGVTEFPSFSPLRHMARLAARDWWYTTQYSMEHEPAFEICDEFRILYNAIAKRLNKAALEAAGCPQHIPQHIPEEEKEEEEEEEEEENNDDDDDDDATVPSFVFDAMPQDSNDEDEGAD